MSRDVKGYRLDYNARLAAVVQAAAVQPAGGGQAGAVQGVNPPLPRLNAKKPPTLEADVDYRKFLLWKPLWTNYANLMELGVRPGETQVAAFWECCSAGFLRTIHHTIGIGADTGREVADIQNRIT